MFNSKHAPIEFELVCHPMHLSGLGIIHPRLMILTISDTMIARVFRDQSLITKAFSLSFLRKLNRVNACFFRLFSEGKFHEIHLIIPYWQRIYETIFIMNLSFDTEWNKYSDEKIL